MYEFLSNCRKRLFLGNKDRSMVRVLRVFFLGIVLLVPVIGQAQDESTAKIIMQLMLQDPPLLKDGSILVGSGSWVTGKNYIDPIAKPLVSASDHDMRLLMPKGTDVVEAKRVYAQVRNELESRIVKHFGAAKADAVLKTTTLYPPEQVMYGVTSEADAELVIRSLGFQSPNLGDQAVEGLYGRGRRAFVRSYETSKGRAFYKSGKSMTSGRADILPQDTYTGFSQSTVFGAAANVDGFIGKTMDGLAAGDARVVAKQIERIEASLMKAQGLSGLDRTQSAAFKKLLADMKKNPDLFIHDPKVMQQLSEYARQAKLKANLLRNFKHANSADKQLIKTMIADIDGSASGGKFAQMFKDVPMDKIGTALNVAFTAYTAYIIHGKYQDGDVDGALRTAGVSAAFKTLGLGPGVIALMANTMIDQAKGLGLAFYSDFMQSVTATQSCDDLLAGMFTVRGREHNIPDASVIPVSIEQLVRDYHRLEDVQPFVEALVRKRALQASQRGFGPVTEGLSDSQVADQLVKNCVPYVLMRWHMERLRLETEFLSRYVMFQDATLVLQVDPEPTIFTDFKADNKVRIKLKAPFLDLHGLHQEMEDILEGLAGRDRRGDRYKFHLWLSVDWFVNGHKILNKSQDPLNFEFPVENLAKSYEVKAEVKLQYRFAGPTGYPNVLDDIVKTEVATIDVEFGSLRIEPPVLTDAVAHRDYEFTFTGQNVPANIKAVRFDYTYGQDGGQKSGSVEAKVVDNRAEAAIPLSFSPLSVGEEGPEGYLLQAVMVSGQDGKTVLAEATAEISVRTASVSIDSPKIVTLTIAPDVRSIEHDFAAVADPPGAYEYRWSFGDGRFQNETTPVGQRSAIRHHYAELKDGDVFDVEVHLYAGSGSDTLLAKDSIQVVIAMEEMEQEDERVEEAVDDSDWGSYYAVSESIIGGLYIEDSTLTYSIDSIRNSEMGLGRYGARTISGDVSTGDTISVDALCTSGHHIIGGSNSFASASVSMSVSPVALDSKNWHQTEGEYAPRTASQELDHGGSGNLSVSITVPERTKEVHGRISCSTNWSNFNGHHGRSIDVIFNLKVNDQRSQDAKPFTPAPRRKDAQTLTHAPRAPASEEAGVEEQQSQVEETPEPDAKQQKPDSRTQVPPRPKPDAKPADPRVTFEGTDVDTKGNWIGRYGAQGYRLAEDRTSLPTGGVVEPSGHSNYVWHPSSTDTRALQKPTGSERLAATWYTEKTSDFMVSFFAGSDEPCRVSLYMVDWDSRGRNQRVEVVDRTGMVLDSRTVEAFQGGQYWTWTVQGEVFFRVTHLGGGNAVVSGVFLDAPRK